MADALHRAADTALQLLGARGYSKDTVVEWIYRYARQARLVDGASEVHRMVLANDAAHEERLGFWQLGGRPARRWGNGNVRHRRRVWLPWRRGWRRALGADPVGGAAV